MTDQVALTAKLVRDYLAQAAQLPAVAQIVKAWSAGAMDYQEAEQALARLGYDIEGEEWPCFFAGVLAVLGDEYFGSLPVEQRATELARALDAGELPIMAAALRPACPAESFAEGLRSTAEAEELVNRLCDASSHG
jgi:hypothetical protein